MTDDQDTPAEAIADAQQISEQATSPTIAAEAEDAVDVAETDLDETPATDQETDNTPEGTPPGDGDDEPGDDSPAPVNP